MTVPLEGLVKMPRPKRERSKTPPAWAKKPIGPIVIMPGPCMCGHPELAHGTNSKGKRAECTHGGCLCTEYLEKGL